MSKIRKAKKLRTPNVPMMSAPTVAAGGGHETATTPSRVEGLSFDYTHIRSDLIRILTIAGSFIGVMVVLAYLINTGVIKL